MKNILCFGDSNTYGAKLLLGGRYGRYERDQRFSGILQSLLGSDYHIIEEGCGGRTTVWDDPIEEGKNGKQYLLPCLWSHMPLDLVIIMLGTNDCKNRFSVSPTDIAWSMDNLVSAVKKAECGPDFGVPKILVVAPIQIGELKALEDMLIGAKEKCSKLPALYENLAKKLSVYYINAGEYAAPDPADGVHLDVAGHNALAKAFAAKIAEIFDDEE